MRLDVTDSFGKIKVGNTLLPGIYQSCYISGNVKMDEIDVPGQSGKSTQPQGFEDATISIQLRLVNDNSSSAYDKAKKIVQVFRAMDKNAKPYVYRIVNYMTNLWGIKEVIFTDLSISDSNTTDVLDASISFREYKPVSVKKEQTVAVLTKQSGTSVDTTAKKGFAANESTNSSTSSTTKLKNYKNGSKYPANDDD
jgi:hypothetical protein